MNRKIRVRRKPPKRRRRGFAQAVVDYPASDWYIYAAVIDLRPPDSSPSSAAPSLPPQRFGQSQVQASGWGSNDAVRNSPRVRRELAEGIGSLLGWRKGVRRKKTETCRKVVGGSRKACREFNHDSEKELQIKHGPMIKLRHQAKVWTMLWELTGSSLGLCRRYRKGH
ncbi:hypothetical protein B296_00011726 [Ensete ventricosum]|uniref:Uncharacterized protein n=1 Tax=Ensete ventricosum TaxID=4639 RepID=A0A426ZVU0_ENSVE|nr:hypothetical protein B296_00011726 [Ensete ventricosum]